MKTIISGMGFLIASLMVTEMLERFGIELDTWVIFLLFGIGILMIIWGLTPSKVKDWTKEKVGVILPSGYRPLDKASLWERFCGFIRNILHMK